MGIAIVAVAYNRPVSFKRLLYTICHSYYEQDDVDLFISIDKGERQKEIVSISRRLRWPYGKKIIRTFTERQGLRLHVIKCGDLTERYDAVIVLEDDIMVSPYFYWYARQAIAQYGNDRRIAGIALYKHQMHLGLCRPFEPADNGYDAFMMQLVTSWGQCWTRDMWRGFRSWYNSNQDMDLSAGNLLPSHITRWDKRSWVKYFMRYIVEKDKYFIYPYSSLSTNCAEEGEHNGIPNNDYQASLQEGRILYRFPSFEDAVKYDIFFERMEIEDKIFPKLKGKKILDLYGDRKCFPDSGYAISTQALPYRVVRTVQLRFRPMEMNCIMPVRGSGIYVYDLTKPCRPPRVDGNIVTRYDVRSISWKRLLHFGCSSLFEAIRRKLQGSSSRDRPS